VIVKMLAGSSLHIYANPEHPLLLFQTIPLLHLTSANWVVLNWGCSSACPKRDPLTGKPLGKTPLRLPSTIHMVPERRAGTRSSTRIVQRALDAATCSSGACAPCFGSRERPRTLRSAERTKSGSERTSDNTKLASTIADGSARRLLKQGTDEGLASASCSSALDKGLPVEPGSVVLGRGTADESLPGPSSSMSHVSEVVRLLRSAFDIWRASCIQQGVP
jgi:hypothetical protein